MATSMVVHVARHYIPTAGMVYDLGASTGNIGKAIAPILHEREAEFVAIDSSEAMEREYTGPRTFEHEDIRGYQWLQYDLAVAFLTLTFLHPLERIGVIHALQKQCNIGGAVMVVDKTEAVGGYAGTVIRRITLAEKVASGVDAESIVGKELSLTGVQRPLMPNEVELLGVEVFRF